METKFDSLNLKKELLTNLKSLNFTHMTPIQAQSLPSLLEGRDVMAQAKTGSGKTAAFGLCILNSLDIQKVEIQSLVLCPTRELAEQVAEELRRLARSFQNTKILTICGGSSEPLQVRALDAGAHIVVGTPGRVLHHLNKGSLSLDGLKVFTLDEADRMLDMGFHEDIMRVVDDVPKACQALLFSATYPDNIHSLGAEIQNDPLVIKTDVTHSADNIEQVFFEVQPSQDKNDFLYKILSQYRPDRAIVFCRTKKDTYDVAKFLANRKIYADCLNGDLDQSERTEVLEKFSNQSLSILVATDVAARGLDIEELAAVVNYDMPTDAESYVHRIGRTGRAGKTGLAFNFFRPEDDEKLHDIEQLIGKKCKIKNVSTLSYEVKYNLVPPMQTMYVSGGKKDKLRPGDILGALVGEAKLDAKDIGDIAIKNSFSLVAIKAECIEQAINKLSKAKIKKKKFKVGYA